LAGGSFTGTITFPGNPLTSLTAVSGKDIMLLRFEP
jgi:hypothetical protein